MPGTKAVLAPLAILLAAAPAAAVEPIDAAWPQVARVRDGACELTVSGNGRFYRIAASGLEPGEQGRFFLSNGDMPPLDWRIRANGDGEFARYYLPFRHNRNLEAIPGDTVRIAVQTFACDLTAAFEWRRAQPVVH